MVSQAFTLIGMVEGLAPWPPTSRKIVQEGSVNGVYHCLYALPSGQLEVVIISHEHVAHALTCEVVLLNAGNAFTLTVSWCEGTEPQLFINSEVLGTHADTPVVVKLDARPSAEPSLGHSRALEVCATAMDARRTRNIRQAGGAPGDARLATPAEDLRRLDDSAKNLEEFVNRVRCGETRLVEEIRGGLRQLVVRASKNDPLLQRAAAHFDLPLPVWALPKYDKATKAVLRSVPVELHVSLDSCETIRTLPGQQLCDLDDWLRRPAHFQGGSLTVNDLIYRAANTLGGAHSDPLIPQDMEALESLSNGNVSFLSLFFCHVGDTVVQLSQWVVRERARRG